MRVTRSVGRATVLGFALSGTIAVANAQVVGAPPPAPPSAAAAAQPVAAPPAASRDLADQLAANLMILSQRPRDVNALISAGLSAIAIGDGNAALGFLGRAEEISPANGRVKAALGSALLLVERPTDALRLFAEAEKLGIADRDIARDRGLAYDLRGDARRAQRDYELAMQRDGDDELTRRYALSLGISGDLDKALTLLDPLLRKQDQAAWRARAFVLAMNGDISGAERIAGSVMPAGSGTTMSSFLRRLGSLNAAERALAVNFGTMPSDGQRYAGVETGDPFRPVAKSAGDGLIPMGGGLLAQPVTLATNKAITAAPPKEPRRRSGSVSDTGRAIVTAPAAPPSVTNSTTRAPVAVAERIGKRIGPVVEAPPPQVVAITSLTKLPPPSSPVATGLGPSRPDMAATNVSANVVVVEQLPTVAPKAAPDTVAIFEVAASPVAPDAVKSALPPAQIAAMSTPPSEAPRIPVFKPPVDSVAVVVPVPSPTQVVISAPVTVPTNAPAVITIVPQAAEAVMGPPSPASAEPGIPAENALPSLAQLPATVTQADPAFVASPSPAIGSVVAPAILTGLGAIIATIEPETETAAAPLPTASELRALRVAAQRKADSAAKADTAAKVEKEKREAERAEAAKHPPRLWVQVAGGANKSGLPATWQKMRGGNASLLKGLTAWSTPLNRTNRLLVGPFTSSRDARDLVNKMGKSGISAFTFSSVQGQEIEKLSAR